MRYEISVDENIRRIFLTSKLTKTLRPNFGLSRYIDKSFNLVVLNEIKSEIIEQIELFEPRIMLKSIEFNGVVNGKLDINLIYEVKTSALSKSLRLKI